MGPARIIRARLGIRRGETLSRTGEWAHQIERVEPRHRFGLRRWKYRKPVGCSRSDRRRLLREPHRSAPRAMAGPKVVASRPGSRPRKAAGGRCRSFEGCAFALAKPSDTRLVELGPEVGKMEMGRLHSG